MSNASTATFAADDDEVIYDMCSLIRVFRSGRVERFEPIEAPPSVDLVIGVKSEDIIINPTTGVFVRFYCPLSADHDSNKKLPIIVFCHGDLCVHRASSAIYHNYLNLLAGKATILVVSVDFRLAPEHPLPIAYDDSWEALQWVLGGGCGDAGDCDRVILAGDSAGANIAHNLCMRLGREGGKVEGMVIMDPYFWGKERIGVEREGAREGRLLKVQDVDRTWSIACPGTTGPDDPRLNPIAEDAPSLAELGCRRVLVSVGEMDLLVDRARLYCEKLKDSGWGGAMEITVAGGEDHGFFLAYPGNGNAAAFMESFISFCNKP